ncbi:L,D-transpeptidase family protein [Sphingomonas sp.]|uniref:L,D-transpeptidase family protein n=1 Tax=Sphingomonas sp. TaxID=28214 RepID=UPI0018270683|nr:L,D-transpeptidase family protein [Sphingomonas sp.]MBA3511330.1 L,D-transpeptidase family protein [Sphingomonas sp.]
MRHSLKPFRLLVTAAALGLSVGLSAPALAQRAQPIEPIDLPPSVEQGVDMIYIDPEIAPKLRDADVAMHQISFEEWAGAPYDLFLPVNPIYTELRRGLVRYKQKWGDLPQFQIPAGAAMKVGSQGMNVAMLRQRFGLLPGDKFDEQLAIAVKEYQAAHGLKADGVAGAGTIASLNLGSRHYERLIIVNLERARRLPLATERGRYVLVDVGAAKLFLYENGRPVDSMKVIVGKADTATPMMAAQMRYADVNPYWNVPPELVISLIAPNVLKQGMTYLKDRRYEVLADWSDEAQPIDPATVDWPAVAAGRKEIRVRQLPGGGNSMGQVKFMMPNDFGIYLHDTPNKALFADEDRWVSNGCIRVEDAQRLAAWLMGGLPRAPDPDRPLRVDIPEPVPVFITYLTASATPTGIAFRNDPYRRDAAVIARYFGDSELAAR